MFRPSDLMAFLNELGVAPKKSLSQNFLIDGNIIQKIIQSASVKEGDSILEIGPGPGALTQALLNAGARVDAVELDSTYANALQRLQTPDQRLIIHEADILKFDPSILKGKYKVIANLPYHLTTPIITKLIPLQEQISSLTVMVQEEVARRFTAKSGCKEFGSISLFLQYWSTPSYQFKISRNCFYPKPKVDSAIIHLELHPPPIVSDADLFFTFIRTAFSERRKMMRNPLKKLFSEEVILKAFEKTGIRPDARAEMLNLQQWIALFEVITTL